MRIDRFALPAGAAALMVVGCGHGRMMPAPLADVVPGMPSAAFCEVQGVRMAADGDDWSGRPKNLGETLTPVKVRIVNHSGKPVRVMYERFELDGVGDRAYHPLPVVAVDHTGAHPLRPIYGAENFFVGPRYHDVYPSLPAWPTALPRDATFYDQQFEEWARDLPSDEMRRMALPEGVLADGGQVSGFIYFEGATHRERKLWLRATLDDGNDGQKVAAIEIPFKVE